jgi:hypothetical protein
MAHPNETMLRDVYAAFVRGDMSGVLANCSKDIVWHAPGKNQLAGDYKGHDGFATMVGKVMQLCGGTFVEELRDALANDQHGIALAHHTLERNGKKFAYDTVHVWRIENGTFTEWWEHPNPVAFDEAWA